MRLTKRLETLLLMACKHAGSFDPEEALPYIEEYFSTVAEYKTAEAFLTWVHTNELKFGTGNLKERFQEFVNSARGEHVRKHQ